MISMVELTSFLTTNRSRQEIYRLVLGGLGREIYRRDNIKDLYIQEHMQ